MNKVAVINPQTAPVTRLPIMAGGNVTAIIPKSIDEAFRVAEAVCVSGMIPDSYKGPTQKETASRVMMGIMKGMEVGLPPITALSSIYIVNNRPSIWGDAALALVQHNAQYAGCEESIDGKPEADNYTATCKIRRKVGDEIVETIRSFSWADAKRAKLTHKGPWQQYPQRMLQMRARAWCIRDSFADALSGLQIREEMEDLNVKPQAAEVGFLEVGTGATAPEEITTDWPATARMFSDAVSKITTQADMDAFLDISSGQREVMKAEAPDLWTFLEEEINKKSLNLAAPKK